ncbi:MAG: biotin--[acetyl-CoA-carboxylase] ligase [Muribaculaceae bacterium]|nr:biotin--[acetyl-CoA-carboxylase] ligase [Muribaculaceae bacterium]
MRAPIFLQSCRSTNSELARQPEPGQGLTVWCHTQTAGRGQRGNSWESEPGKNLTFSTMLMPADMPAGRQFELSMLVSLAITDTLDSIGVEAMIKWPNDIYAGGDRKLCGILIENSLAGTRLERAIAGVGLNVNQSVFLSDAPNPVSLLNITGREHELEPLLCRLTEAMTDSLASYERGGMDAEALKARYRARLWRGTGIHPFRDTASGERFEASIEYVASDGTLTLRDTANRLRQYLFKEVEFLLK